MLCVLLAVPRFPMVLYALMCLHHVFCSLTRPGHPLHAKHRTETLFGFSIADIAECEYTAVVQVMASMQDGLDGARRLNSELQSQQTDSQAGLKRAHDDISDLQQQRGDLETQLASESKRARGLQQDKEELQSRLDNETVRAGSLHQSLQQAAVDREEAEQVCCQHCDCISVSLGLIRNADATLLCMPFEFMKLLSHADLERWCTQMKLRTACRCHVKQAVACRRCETHKMATCTVC